MSLAAVHMFSIVSFTLLRPRVLRLVRYDIMTLMVRLLLRLSIRSRLRIFVVTFGSLHFMEGSLRLLRMGGLRLIRFGFGLGVLGPQMSVGLWAMV